ncbi:MAG: hypothetical protein EOP11_02230 [Proteobacteria bacterium]|nr:MAG: hypothetical protein EOP11_02230 [Pseudomonadota bacterium]
MKKTVELEAPKPAPTPTPAPPKPKTFGAPILTPGFDAPLNAKIVDEETPAAPAPLPQPVAPPVAPMVPEICEENTIQASTLPILDALKAAETLRATPMPPARPSDLQLRIAYEGAGADPVKKGIAPYDPNRDIWTADSIPWKKYDREKRAMGIIVAPAVSDQQFAAVVAKLGKRLSTVEARVRLQKAINALALELDRGKARSPTVFQDGVLGSRTRNAVVYYYQKNPAAFLRALKSQGFRPGW